MKKFRILLIMLLSLFSFSNASAFSIESYDALLKNIKTQEKKYIGAMEGFNLNAGIAFEVFRNKPGDIIFGNWEIICLQHTDRWTTSKGDCPELLYFEHEKFDNFTFNDLDINGKINIFSKELKPLIIILFFGIPLNYFFLYPFLNLFYEKKRTNTQYLISSIIITFVLDIYFYYLGIHTLELLSSFGGVFYVIPIWFVKFLIGCYGYNLHRKNKRA